MKAATLCLGVRKDAITWENGCKDLGMIIETRSSVRKPRPDKQELQDFFNMEPDWIFFGGHYILMELYNDASSVKIHFESDRVNITADKDKFDLDKDSGTFKLQSADVILWGGCSVCADYATRDIGILRKLFAKPVILGFSSMTGPKMVDAMLGADFIKTGHFFERVEKDPNDPDVVCDAWMRAALKGYGGSDIENRFRAIHSDGTEFKIVDKKIIKGRTFH